LEFWAAGARRVRRFNVQRGNPIGFIWDVPGAAGQKHPGARWSGRSSKKRGLPSDPPAKKKSLRLAEAVEAGPATMLALFHIETNQSVHGNLQSSGQYSIKSIEMMGLACWGTLVCTTLLTLRLRPSKRNQFTSNNDKVNRIFNKLFI